jgi:hypothetical protein
VDGHRWRRGGAGHESARERIGGSRVGAHSDGGGRWKEIGTNLIPSETRSFAVINSTGFSLYLYTAGYKR